MKFTTFKKESEVRCSKKEEHRLAKASESSSLFSGFSDCDPTVFFTTLSFHLFAGSSSCPVRIETKSKTVWGGDGRVKDPYT